MYQFNDCVDPGFELRGLNLLKVFFFVVVVFFFTHMFYEFPMKMK